MEQHLVVLLAAVLPLVLLAAWLGIRAWTDLRRAWQARGWLPVAGVVMQSEVEEVLVRVRVSTSVNATRLVLRYRPRVVYRYTANGATHWSDRLHFGAVLLSSDTTAASHMIARLPPGAVVTIYYNPANPADAVLERRVGWGTHALWLTTLLVLATAVGITLVIVS